MWVRGVNVFGRAVDAHAVASQVAVPTQCTRATRGWRARGPGHTGSHTVHSSGGLLSTAGAVPAGIGCLLIEASSADGLVHASSATGDAALCDGAPAAPGVGFGAAGAQV